MNDFIHIPANRYALSRRSPVFGFGINDAHYMTTPKIDGKIVHCPLYRKWVGMLHRTCSDELKEKYPTYKECYVVDEWLKFSTFRQWMCQEDWENKELDKDIIIPGNKEYGPSTCVFVSHEVNTLLNDHASDRGDLPRGVKTNGKRFQARLSLSGRREALGTFDTPEEASKIYILAKSREIIRVANLQENIRVKNGLLRHEKLLREGLKNAD